MFYEKVLRRLLEKKVRFAITGGLALVMHGVVRFTADLDLIIDLSHENLKRFIEAMEELNFRPRIPVELQELLEPEKREAWIREKNMVVFTLYNPQHEIEEIDIFIKEMIPFREIEEETLWMKVKDITIPVISKAHLKRLKNLSNRPQDIADVKALEELERIGDEQKD